MTVPFVSFRPLERELDADLRRGRYNPFAAYGEQEQREAFFQDVLKMLLGRCLFFFDRLPLVQDVSILKSILCAGLWAQFEQKYSRKKEPDDVSGSV